jgi:hypothetical protein
VYVDDAAFGCPMLEDLPGFKRDCVNWSIVGPALDRRVEQHVAGG